VLGCLLVNLNDPNKWCSNSLAVEMDKYITEWMAANGTKANCDQLGFAQCFLQFNVRTPIQRKRVKIGWANSSKGIHWPDMQLDHKRYLLAIPD
jgi:hypothetical protein